MMKRKQVIRIVLLIITIILLRFNIVSADVGSFDRYDDGGSSWSSSSSSWDYDSSGGWSSWDNDYSYSGSGDFILGMLLGSTNGRIATIIIVIGIIAFTYIRRKGEQDFRDRFNNQRHETNNNYYGAVYTTEVHDVPQTHIYAEEVKKVDPLFSEDKFLSWAKDLYVKMQHAWTDRNWEEMRYLETEELFEQHSAQVQGYIKNNTINVVERISVNYATIYGFRQTADKDIIEVALKATKKDYIIDANTKTVIEGNKNQDRITVYKMTFERTKGILTKEGTDDLDAKNCPNCGAPLKMTSSGKCEYCGSIVTTGVHDWVLSGLEPLRRM